MVVSITFHYNGRFNGHLAQKFETSSVSLGCHVHGMHLGIYGVMHGSICAVANPHPSTLPISYPESSGSLASGWSPGETLTY